MENLNVSITPSEVIEYLYCPRFIYFMLYLKIPQNEEHRYKVQLGREVHQMKSNTNKQYLRKKIDVKDRLFEQKLASEKYHIHGIVDEILFLKNGTAAPLDYKFAEYSGRVFNTYKYQTVMYGMLIEENYGLPVEKGFLVYTRSKNKLIEIEITKNDQHEVLKIVEEIIKILDKGFYPKATNYTKRCDDCCYRNICVK